MLNEQLISELPQLLDLRIPYFDPSFEAMIRMQCKFAEEGYEKLGGVQRFDMPSSRIPLRSTHARFPDTLRIMFGMIMLADSWMRRYVVCLYRQRDWGLTFGAGGERAAGDEGIDHLRRQLNVLLSDYYICTTPEMYHYPPHTYPVLRPATPLNRTYDRWMPYNWIHALV